MSTFFCPNILSTVGKKLTNIPALTGTKTTWSGVPQIYNPYFRKFYDIETSLSDLERLGDSKKGLLHLWDDDYKRDLDVLNYRKLQILDPDKYNELYFDQITSGWGTEHVVLVPVRAGILVNFFQQY